MLSNHLHIRIGNKRIRSFDFTWLLFLGVLPFEKAALTLYSNAAMGEMISLALNAITLVGAFMGFMNIQFKTRKTLAHKYILYFVVLIITYLFAYFVDQILITRFLSLVCLLGYCLFAICHYDGVDKLLRDINKALLLIIVLSFVLYIGGSRHVLYTEYAGKLAFKGIVANRNAYSEISLFYIATSYYIWLKDKKRLWWRLITTFVAVYTTFLTNGATSIICMCLLLILLIGSNIRPLRKVYSFNLFLIIYMVVFSIIVLSQYSNIGIVKSIAVFFGKTISLTGRTDIWATTIESVFESPLFGLGYDTSILLKQGIIENDPHNGLLHIALTQGVIGLVAFVSMLFFAIKNNDNEEIKKNHAYMTMLAFVIVWLVKGLVESVLFYTHFVFWCALIVMEVSLYNVAEKKYG